MLKPFAPAPFHMPFIRFSNSYELHYQQWNPDGMSTVCLMHGLGATCESWQLQVPSLVAAGYRVVAPDARGFGKSSFHGHRVRIKDLAGDMAALCAELQTGPVALVGISMGGTIALQFALDHPGLTKKLVLVNTFAKLRPKTMKSWVYFALRFLSVHLIGLPVQARAVARHIFPTPHQELLRRELYGQIIQASPSGYRAAMRALALFNVSKQLSTLTVPTLVITGAQDTTIAPMIQAQLVQGIPGARQVVIPEAGHAVTADQPERFNQVLLNFLNDHTPTSLEDIHETHPN